MNYRCRFMMDSSEGSQKRAVCQETMHFQGYLIFFSIHTVDGRNPAPFDMANISLFTGFYQQYEASSSRQTLTFMTHVYLQLLQAMQDPCCVTDL